MVTTVHWNPRAHSFKGLRFGRRLNNFGDLLGPVIVRELCKARGLDVATADERRLLAVGSIMHFARDGDTVWGSGVNGKMPDAAHHFRNLDVRAVRGPRTQQWLAARGISAPTVFGDPALLVPRLFPDLLPSRKHREFAVLPNLHDAVPLRKHAQYVSPQWNWRRVVREIAGSEFVVGSSLHGCIIADAFGVPAVAMESSSEHPFKYLDYVEGTGRAAAPPTRDLDSAVREGRATVGRGRDVLTDWSADSLLAAFPEDLWWPGPSREDIKR